MDYYQILKVPKNATQSEIRNSYKKLIKQYHPDIYKGDKKFAEETTQELNTAYSVLSNEEKKKEYDLELQLKENPIINRVSPNAVKRDYTVYYQQESEQPPKKDGIEEIMKKKIHKIVNEKTQKMSNKAKILAIVIIILFALLSLILTTLEYIKFFTVNK